MLDLHLPSDIVSKPPFFYYSTFVHNTLYTYELSFCQVRLLTEKVSDQPESHDDQEKIVEYSIPSWQVHNKPPSMHPSLSMSQVLNGLEQMGYRVVTSSCMVTGFTKHDTRDFIWTMHKAKEDWEASSM